MAARQMKEREESLLSILGYKKFISETSRVNTEPNSSSAYLLINQQNNIHKNLKNGVNSNNIKPKKDYIQKYLKVPQFDSDQDHLTQRLYTDNGYFQQKQQSQKQPNKIVFIEQLNNINSYNNHNHSTTNYTNYQEQSDFSSELPLLSSKSMKQFQKVNPNDNSLPMNLYLPKKTIKQSSPMKSFREDYNSNKHDGNAGKHEGNAGKIDSNPGRQESDQIIEDIFINQQQQQRLSTPLLTQQANTFSRSRKSLLLQFYSTPYQQEIMKKKLQAITSLPSSKLKQISSENQRNISQIFKDFKLDLKNTTNSLQKAKIQSPTQREQNGNNNGPQSNQIISSRVQDKVIQQQKKSQKKIRNVSDDLYRQDAQQIGSLARSTVLAPLNINSHNLPQQQNGFSLQISPKEKQIFYSTNQSDECVFKSYNNNNHNNNNNNRNNNNLKTLMQNPNSQGQLEKKQTIKTNQNNNDQQNIPQIIGQTNKQNIIEQSNKQQSITELNPSLQQNTNRWKFNHPVSNQPTLLNPDQIQNNNNGQDQQPTPSSLLISEISNQLQSQQTLKQSQSIIDKEQQSKRKINVRFDNNNIRENDSKKSNQNSSRNIKFSGAFDTSKQKQISNTTNQTGYQKYKTTTLTNIPQMHDQNNNNNQESKIQAITSRQQISNNFDKKTTLQNFDFLEQFSLQQFNTQRTLQPTPSNLNQLKQSLSSQNIQNKLRTTNLNRNISPVQTNLQDFTPSINQKRMSKQNGQLSPKSTTSPIKRRLHQQQVHEDNYIVIHSYLIESLNSNEILKQYIESSGYSIEMFAFYMMKLYNYCNKNISLKLQKNNENNSNNDNGNNNNINSLNNQQALSQSELFSEQFNQIEQQQQQLLMKKGNSEFPTLKVSESTLISVLEIFCEKMRLLSVPSQQIRVFEDMFKSQIKQFMPQTFIDDVGGVEKIKTTINKLLEYLCYENGIISSFDSTLINYIADGTLSLLRFDQQQLEPFLAKLKQSTIPISNAEFYLVKIALNKVMTQLNFPNQQIFMVLQRINKQRGYFFSLNDYSKDSSFKNIFIQSISKNKKIIGYFLDPSQNNIHSFYDILFSTLNGGSRYIDLIDYFEHKLKTSQTPLIMIDEIQKTIIEIYNSTQNEPSFLMQKDVKIKLDRVRQKAGLLNYSFLKIGMSIDELVENIIEWCEYALISINLPHGMQEDSIIKPDFLREYLFLVLSEEEQLFSIFDLDYAISYHSINNFEYCFSLWLNAISDILSKKMDYPKENISHLLNYLHNNSILP